MNRKRANKVSL